LHVWQAMNEIHISQSFTVTTLQTAKRMQGLHVHFQTDTHS